MLLKQNSRHFACSKMDAVLSKISLQTYELMRNLNNMSGLNVMIKKMFVKNSVAILICFNFAPI